MECLCKENHHCATCGDVGDPVAISALAMKRRGNNNSLYTGQEEDSLYTLKEILELRVKVRRLVEQLSSAECTVAVTDERKATLVPRRAVASVEAGAPAVVAKSWPDRRECRVCLKWMCECKPFAEQARKHL